MTPDLQPFHPHPILRFFDVDHARYSAPHDLQARADQVKRFMLLAPIGVAAVQFVSCLELVPSAEVDILTVAIGRGSGDHTTLTAFSSFRDSQGSGCSGYRGELST